MLKNSLSAMLDFWGAYEHGIQKISWGTSQFVDWAACGVLNRSKMVLSGDVPSNCSLASFRHARFFDFFNEIHPTEPFPFSAESFRSRTRSGPFRPVPKSIFAQVDRPWLV